MKNRPLTVGAVLLALTAVLWLMNRPQPNTVPEVSPDSVATTLPSRPATSVAQVPRDSSTTSSPQPPLSSPDPTLPTEAPATASPATLSPDVSRPPPLPTPPVNFPAVEISADLEGVRMMLQEFRNTMGENPVGSNSEIMSAVNGNNLKQARIGPPGQQKLNENGELIDRWGIPYFFHQLSGTVMEIRSAGSDRRMWTSDDVVAK